MQGFEQRAAKAAQGANVVVGLEALAIGHHGFDVGTVGFDGVDAVAIQEGNTRGRAFGRQTLGKHMAVASGIVGQVQSTGQLARHRRQCRLILRHIGRVVYHRERHTVFLQHRNVFFGGVHFFFGAENLQSAAMAAFKA